MVYQYLVLVRDCCYRDYHATNRLEWSWDNRCSVDGYDVLDELLSYQTLCYLTQLELDTKRRREAMGMELGE